MADAPNTYDDLPYSGNAFVLAHPDRLAVVGRLYGLDPAPVARARVLELGCGVGGNLIPMATVLPEASFLGIDLSHRQIESGRGLAAELGLGNIDLRCQDIMDLDCEADGPFDYILCHGVFSWVPGAVQDRILDICARGTSDNGLAMISYNAQPVWHFNLAVRDILRYGARAGGSPAERVRMGLEFLSFVARNVFSNETPYSLVVRAAAEALAAENPTYVFHEYLEECNSPVCVEDFDARASAVGLRYVGEACLDDVSGLMSEEARKTLNAMSDDHVRCEQVLDFLRARQFRRDVLCRADLEPERWPSPAALDGMLLVSRSTPASKEPDITSEGVEKFLGPSGRSLSASEPPLKAAMVVLHRAAPGAMTFEDLLAGVRNAVGKVDETMFRRSMIACATAALVELHTHVPSIADKPSDKPLASPLARRQAAEDRVVVDLYHRGVQIDPLTAAVLSLLDGTRTLDQVSREVAALADAGALTIEEMPEGGRHAPPETMRDVVAGVLDALARLGLLVA